MCVLSARHISTSSLWCFVNAVRWVRTVHALCGRVLAPRYIAIYRDFFDTGIEMLVLTILIKVSKVSHSTSRYHRVGFHLLCMLKDELQNYSCDIVYIII